MIQKNAKWYLIWWWYIRCDHSRSFKEWFYHMQLDYHDGSVPFCKYNSSKNQKWPRFSAQKYLTTFPEMTTFRQKSYSEESLILFFRSKNCLDLPHLPLRIIYFHKSSPAEIIQPIYQWSRRVWFQVPPKLLCKMGKYFKSLWILT